MPSVKIKSQRVSKRIVCVLAIVLSVLTQLLPATSLLPIHQAKAASSLS